MHLPNRLLTKPRRAVTRSGRRSDSCPLRPTSYLHMRLPLVPLTVLYTSFLLPSPPTSSASEAAAAFGGRTTHCRRGVHARRTEACEGWRRRQQPEPPLARPTLLSSWDARLNTIQSASRPIPHQLPHHTDPTLPYAICPTTPRRTTPHHAAPRRTTPRHATPPTPHHTKPCHVTPRHTTPHHTTPHHTTPHHTTPHTTTPHHITPAPTLHTPHHNAVHSTPLHSTPLHATPPHHATPHSTLHATMHSTPLHPTYTYLHCSTSPHVTLGGITPHHNTPPTITVLLTVVFSPCRQLIPGWRLVCGYDEKGGKVLVG